MDGTSETAGVSTTVVVVVRGESSLLRAGGRTIVGRALEMLRRAGAKSLVVACPSSLAAPIRAEVDAAAAPCRLVPADDAAAVADAIADAGQWVLLVEGDVVYDARLLAEGMAWTRPSVLVDSAPPPGRHARASLAAATFAGLVKSEPAQLQAALAAGASIIEPAAVAAAVPALSTRDVDDLPLYSRELRRELRPYWIPVEDRADTRVARKILAAAGGKGHQEIPVLLFNRPVEQFLSYYVAECSITPNQITFLSNVTAFAATTLFVLGMLWPALGLALATAILDGLDGRQARVQIKTSKFGEWEHVFDAISELTWMVGLCWWFSDDLGDVHYLYAGAAWCLFYALDNYAYTFFRKRRDMMLDEASRLDAAIRLVASRRNTNFVYFALALAAGYPAQGLLVVVCLHGVSALVHWIRVVVLLTRPRPRSRGWAQER